MKKTIENEKKMIANRQLKLKTNEPLSFIFCNIEYANFSEKFHLYCKKDFADIPDPSFLKTKLKEEIASTLNKIQSIHKKQNKTLLDLQDLHLAFQIKNELIPKIQEEIKKEKIVFLRKDYIDLYFASLLELYALDKLSKTNNIIAYIAKLSTSDEIQKQINLLKKEKINFKCFTINLDHIITSIEKRNLFYIFIKDKIFATIYAPI
jgi:hypothetical protein